MLLVVLLAVPSVTEASSPPRPLSAREQALFHCTTSAAAVRHVDGRRILHIEGCLGTHRPGEILLLLYNYEYDQTRRDLFSQAVLAGYSWHSGTWRLKDRWEVGWGNEPTIPGEPYSILYLPLHDRFRRVLDRALTPRWRYPRRYSRRLVRFTHSWAAAGTRELTAGERRAVSCEVGAHAHSVNAQGVATWTATYCVGLRSLRDRRLIGVQRCTPVVASGLVGGGFRPDASVCNFTLYHLTRHRHWVVNRAVDNVFDYGGPSWIYTTLANGVALLNYRYLESVFPAEAAAEWGTSITS